MKQSFTVEIDTPDNDEGRNFSLDSNDIKRYISWGFRQQMSNICWRKTGIIVTPNPLEINELQSLPKAEDSPLESYNDVLSLGVQENKDFFREYKEQ